MTDEELVAYASDVRFRLRCNVAQYAALLAFIEWINRSTAIRAVIGPMRWPDHAFRWFAVLGLTASVVMALLHYFTVERQLPAPTREED